MPRKTLDASFADGMKRRREVLGDAWVDKSIQTKTDFNAEFLDLITRYAWDDIWNRPGLDRKTRRMLVLAMTIGMGRWEEFALHCRASLAENDLTQNQVKEVLLQSAIYCGVPSANTAFKEAKAIIAELAAEKAAAKKNVAKKPATKKAVTTKTAAKT
jgi:4-carboxymuconolactone decarboxylase